MEIEHMSNIFGGGQDAAIAESRAAAEKSQAAARRTEQNANEEGQRNKQRSERGSGGGSRGRDMLVGRLSSMLKPNLGN